MKIGFDNELYINKQSENILKRVKMFDKKLYIEFGGKLFDDFHASRVLPGFCPNAKINILKTLSDKTEIILCISSNDIERDKIREDFGITYCEEVLRLIDSLREEGLKVGSVVITLFKDQPKAKLFGEKLVARGEKVYYHRYTKGYPTNVDLIVSEEGYGANPYIETTSPIVVVTGPGPCSGKLATCLSQLYHEYKHGVEAGYAKFETFPVWNLPLNHPVNIAYEAATADLKDVNIIDPFHFENYGIVAVNYNRDVESFPVLKNILKRITGKNIYNSPTDMGVNMVGTAITDNKIVKEAALQEIIRRYYVAACELKKQGGDDSTLKRLEYLMSECELETKDRDVAVVANQVSKQSQTEVSAIKLNDDRIITGKMKEILSCTSSCLLNALKTLAGIVDEKLLISDTILKPILKLKSKLLHNKTTVLSVEDIVIALSVCATTDADAKKALDQLDNLKNCEMHVSYMLSQKEEKFLKRLNIRVTCEPKTINNELLEW